MKYVVALLFFVICSFGLNAQSGNKILNGFGSYPEQISVGGNLLSVDIADTNEKRAYGLMYRRSMPDSCGMLFVFESSEVQSFWMKNTYIPLSIAYINESGVIVTIKEMEPHNLIGVGSEYPVQYALEVNKGWFAKKNIKVGDSVDF